jgi:hypothetical protein
MIRKRPSILALSLSLAIAASAAVGVAAAPAPSYSATMTSDGACLLTVTATWKNAKIDQVFVGWYLDDVFVATGAAPGLYGTLRGRTATLQFGPATASDTAHLWRGYVQLYSGPVFVASLNPTLPVNCDLG